MCSVAIWNSSDRAPSGPNSSTNGEINTRRGGRGLYFEDPDGHLMEIMTVPE